MTPSPVYLVGAGPGDPELITVRGLNAVRQATVIIYDRLVHPSLVAEAPSQARRIYVGKESGIHYVPQGRCCTNQSANKLFPSLLSLCR